MYTTYISYSDRDFRKQAAKAGLSAYLEKKYIYKLFSRKTELCIWFATFMRRRIQKSIPVCFETCPFSVTLNSFVGACGLSSLLLLYVHICISFESCSSNTQTFANGLTTTSDYIFFQGMHAEEGRLPIPYKNKNSDMNCLQFL